MTDTCILFFVKYPNLGNVKTRLAKVIGEDVATSLYRHFVQDMLKGFEKIDSQLRICYAPCGTEDPAKDFRDWLGSQYTYRMQEGENIGQRMKHAMQSAFDEGFQRVIIVGSDIPDFPPELITKAFLDLDMQDAALGPSYDGGYYLIGFRKDTFLPEVFDNIPWSTRDVYRATLEKIQNADLDLVRLPDWNDVDTIWDLNLLFRTNRNSSFRKSSTYAILREHSKLIREYDVDLPTSCRLDEDEEDADKAVND